MPLCCADSPHLCTTPQHAATNCTTPQHTPGMQREVYAYRTAHKTCIFLVTHSHLCTTPQHAATHCTTPQHTPGMLSEVDTNRISRIIFLVTRTSFQKTMAETHRHTDTLTHTRNVERSLCAQNSAHQSLFVDTHSAFQKTMAETHRYTDTQTHTWNAERSRCAQNFAHHLSYCEQSLPKVHGRGSTPLRRAP